MLKTKLWSYGSAATPFASFTLHVLIMIWDVSLEHWPEVEFHINVKRSLTILSASETDISSTSEKPFNSVNEILSPYV